MKKLIKKVELFLMIVSMMLLICVPVSASTDEVFNQNLYYMLANDGKEVYVAYNSSRQLVCGYAFCYEGKSRMSAVNIFKGWGKITGLKSSNNAVAMPVKKYNKQDKCTDIYAQIKSTGSAVISAYTQTDGDENSLKLNYKIKVVKYSSPAKKITVGSTDYTSLFKKSPKGKTNKTIKGIVKVVPNKGWKVKSIKRIDDITNTEKIPALCYQKNYAFGGSGTVKTTKSVSVSKNDLLEIVFYNKATKTYRSVWLATPSALSQINTHAFQY